MESEWGLSQRSQIGGEGYGCLAHSGQMDGNAAHAQRFLSCIWTISCPLNTARYKYYCSILTVVMQYVLSTLIFFQKISAPHSCSKTAPAESADGNSCPILGGHISKSFQCLFCAGPCALSQEVQRPEPCPQSAPSLRVRGCIPGAARAFIHTRQVSSSVLRLD